MARKKSNKIIGVFKIFFSSLKTYFLYLDACFKYLAFPVFGQLIGLAIILTIAYYFNTNIENIRAISPLFEKESNLLWLYGLILLPFFIIFVKAVYEYIIAFCSLNILFYTVSNKKKVKEIDFNANKKVIERKLINYIVLMFLVTLLFIVPPFIFVAPIIGIFLCLTFQVFALENDISAPKAISRSIELVKGNFIATTILLALCILLTYWFLPSVFVWASDRISLTSFLIEKIEPLISLFDINSLNNILSNVNMKIDSLTIAKSVTENTIISIIIAFSLPFRCACFTELYKLYDSEKIKDFSKDSDEIIARATGKRKN